MIKLNDIYVIVFGRRETNVKKSIMNDIIYHSINIFFPLSKIQEEHFELFFNGKS